MPPPSNVPDVAALLARVDTARLKQGTENTVALVVLNTGDAAFSGVVRFSACFPIRRELAGSPVTVRDETGRVVPSRPRLSSILAFGPQAPPGKEWWLLEMEFAVAGIPARGGKAFAATYGLHPDSRWDNAAFWRTMPAAADLAVHETDCHPGDLPPTFALP